ncbi:csc1-like protein, partial [Quercus suber]
WACVVIFLSIKLRRDHRRIPSPTALFTKLLAVWHATCREITCHCGSDAAQFLPIEGGSFVVLSSIALLSIFLNLLINLYAGTASLNNDQFFKRQSTKSPKALLALDPFPLRRRRCHFGSFL